MLELTDDYLAAEDYLVERLSTVTGIKKVYRSCDLASMQERSQITPALHVIYGGDRVADRSQGGALSHPEQTWLVVLVVSLTKANDAGKLLAAVIKQLAGVHTALGPLQRQTAQRPSFSAGFGYYPLAYSLKFRLKP